MTKLHSIRRHVTHVIKINQALLLLDSFFRTSLGPIPEVKPGTEATKVSGDCLRPHISGLVNVLLDCFKDGSWPVRDGEQNYLLQNSNASLV